ncbi:MAG: hypothetical protein V1859_09130 [archaeon]
MILIPHIAAGLFVGSVFNNKFAIIVAAIILHFILDAIPHSDLKFELKKTSSKKKHLMNIIGQLKENKSLIPAIFLTICYALIVLFAVYKRQEWINMALGGFFAALPDIYEWLRGFFGLPTIHLFYHGKADKMLGITMETIIVLLFTILLFF